ncbi:hypothetical protein HaLaN_16947 [Haematococcus lacustris]|uniref:Uncharacterized protein n=1 Tax=Haematococcus lacustris TaxID=44745 RepID=A0A699ZDL6_HAELA|nr:hypothetical protein HaLaN_16947 [Haematococcus lacustris]
MGGHTLLCHSRPGLEWLVSQPLVAQAWPCPCSCWAQLPAQPWCACCAWLAGECWPLALRLLAVRLPGCCVGPVGACGGLLQGTTSGPALAGHAAGSRLGTRRCSTCPAGASTCTPPCSRHAAPHQHPTHPQCQCQLLKRTPPAARHAHGAPWTPPTSSPLTASMHTKHTHGDVLQVGLQGCACWAGCCQVLEVGLDRSQPPLRGTAGIVQAAGMLDLALGRLPPLSLDLTPLRLH